MTQGQKEQIDTLREQGNGYKRIAGILGVSVNTIASYCRRKTAVCPCCGAALVMTPKHRKKRVLFRCVSFEMVVCQFRKAE